MAETELDKQTTLITDLTRKVDELQVEADKAARLKDQVDEYVILLSSRYSTNYDVDIVMLRINYRKRRMSWKNTRKSYKKVLTLGSMSRWVHIYPFYQTMHQKRSLSGSRATKRRSCRQECLHRRRIP